MKRIKCIVALVAMVGIFSAQAAEVDSVNMVGFAKVPVQKGINLIGVPFSTVGETQVHLSDLFDVSEFKAGSGAANADKISVWNGTGYDSYILSQYIGTYPNFTTGWASGSSAQVEVDVVLEPGQAVWLTRIEDAKDITLKGQVLSAENTEIALSTGLNMVSYPYSTAGSLADFDISNATAGSGAANADKVSVWNGAGYDSYILSKYIGTYPNFTTGWASGSSAQVEVNVPLAVGDGFWYTAQDTTTGISATKPY